MTEHEASTTYAPVPFDPGHMPKPPKERKPKNPPSYAKPAAPLTKADICLLAIATLEETWKRGGVPKSAIVVEAWKAADPSAFGLHGYEDTHPSDNRVIMELVKMKSRKMIRQPKENHYALTNEGWEIVARLRAKK